MQTSTVHNMPTNLNIDDSPDVPYKKRQSKDPAEDIPLDMDPINSKRNGSMSRTTDQKFAHNPLD